MKRVTYPQPTIMHPSTNHASTISPIHFLYHQPPPQHHHPSGVGCSRVSRYDQRSTRCVQPSLCFFSRRATSTSWFHTRVVLLTMDWLSLAEATLGVCTADWNTLQAGWNCETLSLSVLELISIGKTVVRLNGLHLVSCRYLPLENTIMFMNSWRCCWISPDDHKYVIPLRLVIQCLHLQPSLSEFPGGVESYLDSIADESAGNSTLPGPLAARRRVTGHLLTL